MINTLMRALFKVIFFVLRWLFNLILLPFRPLFLVFPQFTDFLQDAINFFDNYIIKAVGFGREVFLNLTGFPQEIITLSVNAALTIITLIATFKLVSFVLNMWRTFRGGQS